MTLYRGLQLVLSKIIRIGDAKYHIYCSYHIPKSLEFRVVQGGEEGWGLDYKIMYLPIEPSYNIDNFWVS